MQRDKLLHFMVGVILGIYMPLFMATPEVVWFTLFIAAMKEIVDYVCRRVEEGCTPDPEDFGWTVFGSVAALVLTYVIHFSVGAPYV